MLVEDPEDAAVHARLAVHHVAAGSDVGKIGAHLERLAQSPDGTVWDFGNGLSAAAFIHDCERVKQLTKRARTLAPSRTTKWSVLRANRVCAGLPAPPVQVCDAGQASGLSKDLILKSMRDRAPAMQAIYELAIQTVGHGDADLKIRFTIDKDGNGRVDETTARPPSPILERAVRPIIQAAPFARPCGGGVVTITFPYLLRQAPDGN